MDSKSEYVTRVTCEKKQKQVRISNELAEDIDKFCDQNQMDKKTYTTKLLAEVFWENTKGKTKV